MEDNISPEERLLRLIRKDTKRPAKKQEPIIEEPIAEEPAPKTVKIPFSISFELANRLLLASIFILGIYLGVDFLIFRPEKIEEGILGLEVGEIKDEAQELADKDVSQERLEPVSRYSEPVRQRKLFTAASSSSAAARPTPSFMEIISKLKLQGIISGANPQAIIEDSKTKQVYFISPGGYIGEIELKEILPGKVILNYRGQEAELSL